MARKRTGRPFTKGKSGNPRGRPPGIKEPVPRNTVLAAWNAVVGRDRKLVEKVISAGLRLPASKALPFVELGARLNKELGAGIDSGMLPVIINFHSNVDPMKLRRRPEVDTPEDGS